MNVGSSFICGCPKLEIIQIMLGSDKWLDEQIIIYRKIKHYSDIKRNKLLIHTIWRNYTE